MSNINTAIENSQVIPFVESPDLFVGHESTRFAVGMLAMGDQIAPGQDDVFKGYLRLRAKVYADQTQMISPELVRPDGTEMDDDDKRSVHFGIVEQHEKGLRVVGAMRFIMKTEDDSRPLPIETFFPEVFAEAPAELPRLMDASKLVGPNARPARGPAPLGATEASRYICRHEDARVQDGLSFPLFTAATAFVAARNLGPTFGVVEPKVEAALRAKRVPLVRIADPIYVPEYNADNLGIEVDMVTLGGLLRARDPNLEQNLRDRQWDFTYFGKRPQAQPLAPAA